MAEPHRATEPRAWADDLETGEAEVSTRHPEVVQVNEETGMRTNGSGVPVHEKRQPAGPTPHSYTLAIVLAFAAIVIVCGLFYLAMVVNHL